MGLNELAGRDDNLFTAHADTDRSTYCGYVDQSTLSKTETAAPAAPAAAQSEVESKDEPVADAIVAKAE